ncbi:TonB-dependent receptor [Chitinimonas sp.]|uniref:TonB-dependent receptor n=1 Tax=Chitinimonas sp. TaxID=1934313 RepID=UPI002F935E51
MPYRLPANWRFSSLVLAVAAASPAWADDGQPAQAIVITANPLRSNEISSPSSVLQGDALLLRQAYSLGAVLDGLPGVSSTSFGPGASRPIIRGLDGDRIRILQNGVTALDASSLSFDHAVAQDPFSAERIEVVRGPAALLYGGSAIGGVINTLDRRIPRNPIEGVNGQIDLNAGGAARERNAAVALDAGNGQFALHADAASRDAGLLRIPGYAWTPSRRAQAVGEEEQAAAAAKDTLPNSNGRAISGAVGASWTWADGYLGLSYADYQANYGSVAEAGVRLDMHQQHLALAGEVRALAGPIQSVKFDFSNTDYEHKEIEDGEVGTRFTHKGYEARIEARHRPLGEFNGVIGLHTSSTRFAALGEEAFVPQTDSDSHALFLLEETPLSQTLKLSLGGRLEATRHAPDGQGNTRFDGAYGRRYTAGSFSLGLLGQLGQGWSWAANASRTERAPTFYELYANGEHVATGIIERGDNAAGKEKARSLDLALRYAQGGTRASIGTYYSRFDNFIALMPTGRYCSSEGEADVCTDDPAAGVAEYRYQGVPASLHGIEFEGSSKLAALAGSGDWALDWQGDYTRASNRLSSEPLPRIAPLRLAAGVSYGLGPWSTRLGVQHAASQSRVPVGENTTEGYTTLNLSLSYRFKLSSGEWLAYLRGDNLTNQEVRYASSLLRDIAPQGARAIKVGLRGQF